MSTADLLQLVGNLAALMLGVGAIRVGVSADRFSRYGRETLVALGGLLLLVSSTRMLLLFDVISAQAVLVVNGLLAVLCLAIVLQTAWLTRLERHKPAARSRPPT